MNRQTSNFGFLTNIWLTALVLVGLAITFGVYVYTEKLIDEANEQRQISYVLADQLRQSSEDLTRMVRAYAATGDERYKNYYRDILAVRNGTLPRPEGYFYAYWDLVVAGQLPPPGTDGQAVALLDMMRGVGFSDDELHKLALAKTNSDALTELELRAMALVESAGQDIEAPASCCTATNIILPNRGF